MTTLKTALTDIDQNAAWLAREMNRSTSAISRAVNGERCGVDLAFEIAKFMNPYRPISAEDILRDTRPTPQPATETESVG